MAGAIRVDGEPLRRPGFSLRPGLWIEAFVDAARMPSLELAAPRFTILYEDDVLLAVDKPPGLPSVPGADPARHSLFGVVRDSQASRGRGAYLGVHQRLDRDTSGVVLFAKDARANPGLAAAFASHTARKTYHALSARGPRPPAREWSNDEPVGGAAAHTDFRCVRILARGLLVEARPRTGRKHQIRVHLAGSGLPILGDARYGAADAPASPRLMLHASILELPHPLTQAPIRIESPWPADFSAMLAALERPGGSRR
jgi:RluA family pseudouridine synthase